MHTTIMTTNNNKNSNIMVVTKALARVIQIFFPFHKKNK